MVLFQNTIVHALSEAFPSDGVTRKQASLLATRLIKFKKPYIG